MIPIFNTIQTFEEYNKTGLDNMLVYVAQTESLFIPMFLFALFMIILMGTFYGSKRLTGQTDFFVCMMVASFITTMATFLLKLQAGLINDFTFIVVIFVSILSLILLFVTRER